MRVPEELEVLDFSADFSYHIEASDLLAIEYLHGHFMPRQLVFADCRRNQRSGLVPRRGDLHPYTQSKGAPLGSPRKYRSKFNFLPSRPISP